MNLNVKSEYNMVDYLPRFINLNDGILETTFSEIGGLYDVILNVTGTVAGTINVKTKQFNSDTYATKLDIIAVGTYDIPISSDDNYIEISSGDTYTDLKVEMILKKKIDNVITDVADIPTSDVGSITILTPQLEAQGGDCCVDMVWNDTKGKYVTKGKILLYSTRTNIVVDAVANPNSWIQYTDCIFPRDLINRNIEVFAFISPSITTGTKGFRIGNRIVSSTKTAAGNPMQFNLLTFVKSTQQTVTLSGIDDYTGSQNISSELIGTGDVLLPIYTFDSEGGINTIEVVEVYA